MTVKTSMLVSNECLNAFIWLVWSFVANNNPHSYACGSVTGGRIKRMKLIHKLSVFHFIFQSLPGNNLCLVIKYLLGYLKFTRMHCRLLDMTKCLGSLYETNFRMRYDHKSKNTSFGLEHNQAIWRKRKREKEIEWQRCPPKQILKPDRWVIGVALLSVHTIQSDKDVL